MTRPVKVERPRSIDELVRFYKRLKKNGKVKERARIFRAMLKRFPNCSAREHSKWMILELKQPLFSHDAELTLKFYVKEKAAYNRSGDRMEKIIGVEERFVDPRTNKTISHWYDRLAEHDNAKPAREFQHVLNQGGTKKEQDLRRIELDKKLKQRHYREYVETLREAGIN